MTTWRARDSRGHYLPTGEIPYSLEPDAWDDTCRHTPTALEPSSDTFGHEPAWADFGTCVVNVGVCNCSGHDEDRACARCRSGMEPVRWPCTSAVVLGLEPRPAASPAV